MTATAENTTQGTQEQAQAQPTPAPKKSSSTAQKLVGSRYATFINDRGTFNPGYDAKAKSQMLKDAVQTDDQQLREDARAALATMNWTHFLTAKEDMLARGKVTKPRKSAKSEGGEGTTAGSGAAPTESQPQNQNQAPAPNTDYRVHRSKSGFYVLDRGEGNKGLAKFNTQAEAEEVVDLLLTGRVDAQAVRNASNDLAVIRAAATSEASTQGESEAGEAEGESSAE